MDCSLLAPLSIGFPSQKSWTGLPFPPSGNLPDPETEPTYPTLADVFFTIEPPGNKALGISSDQSLSHVWLFAIPWTAAHWLPCPSPTPRACSNSCSSRWCHPTLSSSVIPFSCLQSFPASRFFQWVSSSHQVARNQLLKYYCDPLVMSYVLNFLFPWSLVLLSLHLK